MEENMTYHVPVLLKQSVDGLNIGKGGNFVDVTFGGGGHSREILSRLDKDGHLYSFDQDADAEKNANVEGQRTTDNGQRTTDNGQRTEGNGQRTTDNGQRTEGKGQRTTDNGQQTTDNGRVASSLSYAQTSAS